MSNIKNDDKETVISVKNVSKKFRVYFDKGSSLKERILFRERSRYEEREVLNDISFDVKKGDALGLIGQNGCGKSTMLKLLTRIMYPNSGTIQVKGRVSSLIELGAGFHPDMSGRENIYINASIFGLSKKEIDSRLNDIIDFSELHDYIDNPVRTYSSGMYTRLAFSVAVNVDADILLIDEILAVGDASFQSKCFNKMMDIKAKGTTIVLVSHALGDVEKVCNKAIWIKNGKIGMSGTPHDVVPHYLDWIMGKDSEEKKSLPTVEENAETPAEPVEKAEENNGDVGNKQVEIVEYKIYNTAEQRECSKFAVGDGVKFMIKYRRNDQSLKSAMASMLIRRNDGTICYTTNSLIDTGKNIQLKDDGMIELTIDPIQLMQGNYSVDISLLEDYGPVFHQISNAFEFEIYNTKTDYGVFRPFCRWRLSDE